MKRIDQWMCFLMTLTVTSVMATAQVATGIPPMSSVAGGPFDQVNLGNLNVEFSIPIINKAGRGIPFNFSLVYNSSIWMISSSSGNETWQPATTTWGWQGTEGVLTPYITYDAFGYNYPCGPNDQYSYSEVTFRNFGYYDQWGVQHAFPSLSGTVTTSPGPSYGCPSSGSSGGGSSTTSDGSGYTVTIPTMPPGLTATVVTVNGETLSVPITEYGNKPPQAAFSIQDSNGNQLTFGGSNGQFTDTTGTNILTVSGTNPVTYSYPTESGSAKYTVNYSSQNIQTNFGCSGIAEYSGTASLVTSIVIPDGTKYSFTYDSVGRIASVALPTGGSITYNYPGLNDGIACSDGSITNVTRILNPGGTWTYWRAQVSGSEWQTYVETPPDPQNPNNYVDLTTLYFQQDPNTGNYYETQRTVDQGGTPILTTTTCYNSNNSNCTTTSVSTPISERAVTLQYANNGLTSQTAVSYNATYGFVTAMTQYGYGAGGVPGAALRKTQIAYASLGNGIVDRPSSVTVTDGNGNLLSKTTYAYDEYSLQTTSGVAQHVSVSGSRGNLTTISSYVTASTYLSKHFNYFDTGTVYQATDANNAVTTYGFSSLTATCQDSFPTSVVLPNSLSTSMTWNCNGGVELTAQDANGSTTTTNYTDPNFWRPTSVVAPWTSAATTTTNFTYTPYNTGNQTLENVDSQMLFNNNQSVLETLTTMNQFGQKIYSQIHQGPSSADWDTWQTLYDSFSRASQTSMPCPSSSTTFTNQNQACPSSALTTTGFDALNRPVQIQDGGGGYVQYSFGQNDVLQTLGPAPSGENTKRNQTEYDALGRPTSVCEITTLSGYTTCTQTNSNNGYYTTYSYSVNSSGYPTTTVNQSGQTRVYTYDLLGRLISEQNPESGTTTVRRNRVYEWDNSQLRLLACTRGWGGTRWDERHYPGLSAPGLAGQCESVV